MWIPCTEFEYPEVKALLEGMGFEVAGIDFLNGDKRYTGVVTCDNGKAYANSSNICNEPTVTLPELLEMAAQPEPQPTTDNLAALETLFANFIEAVAEMREAQKNYYKVPKFYRPEAGGVQRKHEKIVDAMIQDVTRKPQ